MKVNQWTIGLAAAGVISFGAVAQADEKPTAQVLTAVSSTVLSGYVSTSVAWNPGKQVLLNRYSYAKVGDQVSLDVVDLKLSSALTEGEYASGYNVELWLGPDAAGLGNNTGAGSGVAIKNANVALNIPVGNGIQAKMGIFDTIVGYESANSIENPNYTRSAGNTIEPTSHTGLLLSYKVCEAVSVSAGVANTYDAALNAGARGNSSQQTYLASISVTAPESFGFLKGAVLTAGVVDGFTSGALASTPDQTLFYVGATIPTGIDKLNLGVSWDHLNIDKSTADKDALAGYISYKLTDKATLNTRVEYTRNVVGAAGAVPAPVPTGEEFGTATLTLDYKLWANVVSRVEYRLDHDLNGARGTTVGATRNNSHALIGQVAYKF